LDCEFESDCCWANVANKKKQQNWILIEGHSDESKLQKNFGGNGTLPCERDNNICDLDSQNFVLGEEKREGDIVTCQGKKFGNPHYLCFYFTSLMSA
jgi:hypothetical protein